MLALLYCTNYQDQVFIVKFKSDSAETIYIYIYYKTNGILDLVLEPSLNLHIVYIVIKLYTTVYWSVHDV